MKKEFDINHVARNLLGKHNSKYIFFGGDSENPNVSYCTRHEIERSCGLSGLPTELFYEILNNLKYINDQIAGVEEFDRVEIRLVVNRIFKYMSESEGKLNSLSEEYTPYEDYVAVREFQTTLYNGDKELFELDPYSNYNSEEQRFQLVDNPRGEDLFRSLYKGGTTHYCRYGMLINKLEGAGLKPELISLEDSGFIKTGRGICVTIPILEKNLSIDDKKDKTEYQPELKK